MPRDLEELFSYPVLVRAVAGAMGMSTSLIVFYPLETARTRLQVDDGRKAQSTPAVVADIFREEGLRGLYRGLYPVLTTFSTSYFVYFFVYNGMRVVLVPDGAKSDALKDIGLAFIAACANVLMTNPLWVVNTRMKLQGATFKTKELDKKRLPAYSGILDALVKIWKNEGVRTLWKGTVPSLILCVNPAVQFMVYESLKRHAQLVLKQKDLSAGIYFLIGAIAKLVATFATYPMQLIQSRVRSGYNEGSEKSIFTLLKGIFSKSGIHGLFKGLEAKLLQTVLTSALMFVCYEKIAAFTFRLMGQPQLIGK